MFSRKGVIIIEKTDDIDEDALMETALEAGAEDMITHDDSCLLYTSIPDQMFPDGISGVNEVFVERDFL